MNRRYLLQKIHRTLVPVNVGDYINILHDGFDVSVEVKKIDYNKKRIHVLHEEVVGNTVVDYKLIVESKYLLTDLIFVEEV